MSNFYASHSPPWRDSGFTLRHQINFMVPGFLGMPGGPESTQGTWLRLQSLARVRAWSRAWSFQTARGLRQGDSVGQGGDTLCTVAKPPRYSESFLMSNAKHPGLSGFVCEDDLFFLERTSLRKAASFSWHVRALIRSFSRLTCLGPDD